MQQIAHRTLGALMVLLLALLLMLSIMVSGCSPQGYVRVDAIKPSFDLIRARHDTYIQADPSLSDVEKRVYLRTGQIIDEVFKAAESADDDQSDQAYLDALNEAEDPIPEYHREEHATYCTVAPKG